MENKKKESDKLFILSTLELIKNSSLIIKTVIIFIILGLIINTNKLNYFEIKFVPVLEDMYILTNTNLLNSQTIKPYIANSILKIDDKIAINYNENTYTWTAYSKKIFSEKDIENIFEQAKNELLNKNYDLYLDIDSRTSGEFGRILNSYLLNKKSQDKNNLQTSISGLIIEKSIEKYKARIISTGIKNMKHIKLIQSTIVFILLGLITSFMIIFIRNQYSQIKKSSLNTIKNN